MSDASRQSLKVSREGIVLIKSFEGFRPRAIRREDGGWIIGYGHTLSAREGASVSEADAELLLRYDLLPVEKTLNETIPAALNQHQFDALVSFAFSVGLDRFAGSDVRQRLAAGANSEAADAMLGWPEPVLPESALRRRAAERALFTADPATPVALADLLAAPLPPPPVVIPIAEPEAEVAEPTADASVDPRGAAVAALLGEPVAEPEPTATVQEFPEAPANDSEESSPIAPEEAATTETVVETPVEEPDTPAANDETLSGADSDPTPDAAPIAEPAAPAEVDPVAMAAARYSPYSAAMVGPLPYLQPASPRVVAPEIEPVEVQAVEVEAVEVETVDEPVVSAPISDAPPAPIIEDVPAEAPVEATPIVEQVPTEALVQPAPVDQLILTSPEDAPEPAVARALWSPEQRAEPAAPESGLFGEDLSLTQGAGPILGLDTEAEPPARFDWSETGAFIIMGAVGLTAFGASMAAFRLASEQSDGGTETTMIAWVLAVIGAACVGVSSFNLYRRWGLPGGD